MQYCYKCGHKWVARKASPKICPQCKSSRWMREETLTCPACTYRWNPNTYNLRKMESGEPVYMCCPKCWKRYNVAIIATDNDKIHYKIN